MKEQVIQIPDTLEIKEIKDGKIILVEKEKKLTYEDVARKLFPKYSHYYFISAGGTIEKSLGNNNLVELSDNTTSKKQAEKLLAINKLMNVAKYLNDGWQPDWSNDNEMKYYIWYSVLFSELRIDVVMSTPSNNIYFKSEELAKQAIEILGEETIKLALCTDY